MKKVLVTVLQLVLFLLVFLAGSFFPPFHVEHVLIATPGAARVFIADGLLLMVALYVLILIVEAIAKRLRTAALWTTVAFLLAILFGFMMKFGFLTRSTF